MSVRAYRLLILTREELEARPPGWREVARHVRPADPNFRICRNPWDAVGDYLVAVFQDPSGIVEPPGFFTAYVTGGEFEPAR
jgi:hypothetical protein